MGPFKLPAITFKCPHCRADQVTEPLDPDRNQGRCRTCDGSVCVYPNSQCGGCGEIVDALRIQINDPLLRVASSYRAKWANSIDVVICPECGHCAEWNGLVDARKIFSLERPR